MPKPQLITKTIIAMGLIAFLEGVALLTGLDGATFGLVIATIAALGGFTVGRGRSNK